MPPLRRNAFGQDEDPLWTSPGRPTEYASYTKRSGMKRVLSNGEITDVADAGYGGEPTVTHVGRVAYQPPPTIDVPARATNPVQRPWMGGGRSGWGQAGGYEVENTPQGNVVTNRMPALESVPDGAEVQHKVNDGPDGTMSTTTAKWIHRNVMATTRDSQRQRLQQDEQAQERLPAARAHELGLTRAQFVEGAAATAAGTARKPQLNERGDLVTFGSSGKPTMERAPERPQVGPGGVVVRPDGTIDRPPREAQVGQGGVVVNADGTISRPPEEEIVSLGSGIGYDRKTGKIIAPPQTGMKDGQVITLPNGQTAIFTEKFGFIGADGRAIDERIIQKQGNNWFMGGGGVPGAGDVTGGAAGNAPPPAPKPATPGTISIVFPDGKIKLVPAGERAKWEAMGGRVR